MRRFAERMAESFWYGSGAFHRIPGAGICSRVLEHIYLAGMTWDRRRKRRRIRRLPVPVISVGNLAVGGTGKTPCTLWIGKLLTQSGIRAGILSRGYGRKETAPAKVCSAGRADSQAERYGDEPVILARNLPEAAVWVGRDRFETGRRAIAEDGVEIIVLDDGFQHHPLHRDLDLVLLDAERPFGNGRLLPVGPLREPPRHLERAGALVLVEPSPKPTPAFRAVTGLPDFLKDKPRFRCRARWAGLRRMTTGEELDRMILQSEGFAVVLGIARPWRFLEFLDVFRLIPERSMIFNDHRRFRTRDLSSVGVDLQRGRYRWILTTEKDAVRFPRAFWDRVVYPVLELDFGPDSKRFRDFILAFLKTHGVPLRGQSDA